MRNLVIVCAGDESWHIKNRWSGKEKEYDIAILYYGKDEGKREEYKRGCEYFGEVEGAKWRNIHEVLKRNDFWKKYRYIWFPDDDLEVEVEGVNRMFRIVEERGIVLSQPSLKDENVSHRGLIHREGGGEIERTEFVEIQMPCIRREEVEGVVMKVLEENEENISGWGIDHYWSRKIEEKWIINEVIVRHTKPVSVSGGFYKKFGIDPFKEMIKIKKKYNI